MWDHYITDDMLQMMFHPFDLQKNKSLNLKIAMVAPKNKMFSATMSLSNRLAFVGIADSIG